MALWMYSARSDTPLSSSSRTYASEKPAMITVASPFLFDTTAPFGVDAVLYDISTRDVPVAFMTSKSLSSGQPPKMKKSSVNARPART